MRVVVTTSNLTGDGSCCCPGSVLSCDCPCCSTGFWSCYRFTVAGITGGAGPCDQMCETARALACNGTWDMSKRDLCNWFTPQTFTDSCGDLPFLPYWGLICQPPGFSGYWVLQGGWGFTVYSCPVGSFSCVTGGTFSFGPGTQQTDACVDASSQATATVIPCPGAFWTPCP